MNAAFLQDGYRSALPRRTAAGQRPTARAGFTLVELIAVMAIIAILAGTVIAGVIYAGRKSSKAATEAFFQRLEIGIRAFHSDYGLYPPPRNPNWGAAGGWDKIDIDKGDPPDHWYPVPDSSSYGSFNNLNSGAETLWYFLAGVYEDAKSEDFEAMETKTAYVEFREGELRRTGEYFWMLPDAYSPEDLFPEIVDPWGSPIQYNAYVEYNGNPQTGAIPKANKDTFDLASRGPDRSTEGDYSKDNDANHDNICNFELE